MWERDKCKTYHFANEYIKLPFPKLVKNYSSDAIDGMACVNNKTLSIIAMDSLLHYQFAEGLGINILDVKDRTAVVIIDKRVIILIN